VPRFAAIAFSSLALEIAVLPNYHGAAVINSHGAPGEAPSASFRENCGGARPLPRPQPEPFAVVVSHPGGAVQGEASLVGNTRLTEVSPEAMALGVRAGQTLAAAKARLSTLRVRVVPQAAVQAALVTVAEMALAFGATTSFETGGAAGDVVWVDITGCAHLHADARNDTRDGERDESAGESALAAKLARAVLAMGHRSRVAIADGVRVAAAVARFAREKQEQILVPVHGNARAMARLPLAALGLSSDALGWLTKIGARRVGDLQRLPRAGLAARLGPEAVRVMALLEGDDRAPLRPHVPPEKPLERVVLEYGLTHHEALFFVLKRLCDRLAARLVGRVAKASKLLLRLEVDHAVSGAPPKDPTLPVTLASPLAKADELFAVLRAKVLSPDGAARIAIEHEEDGTMDVPILAVSLEVTEQVAAESVPQHLFVPEAKAERTLPRVVAELSAALGSHAVGVLSVVDTWVTAERSRLVPYKTSPLSHAGATARARLLSQGEEMSRLLPAPKTVARSELREVRLVSRSEQVEWWKPGSHAHDAFVAFWEGSGERAGERGMSARGMAWVSIDRETGDAQVLGWLD